MRYVLDTSFLIDLERRNPDAQRMAERLDSEGAMLLVPTPVLAEFLVGAVDPAGEAQRVAEWAEVEPFDRGHAIQAAALLTAGFAAGRAMGFADALISGYAAAQEARIVTADARAFAPGRVVTYRRQDIQ